LDDAKLIERLDSALSREEGLLLLRLNSKTLTDGLANTLFARAKELETVGEAISQDYSAWASEARSLVTLELTESLKDIDNRRQFLSTQRDRFDDGLYDVCYKIASDRINHTYSLLEPADESESDSAAVAKAQEETRGMLEFMGVVAAITQNPQHRAKNALLNGTALLFYSWFEAREGRASDAERAAAEAEKALQEAASSLVIPAELRSLAEMRLAALAGPSKPDVVAQHQQAGLSIALAGKAWNAASVIRRDRAYWAREKQDWRAVFGLYRENIEMSEMEFWGAHVFGDAAALEERTQPDYEGAVQAGLELGKSDHAFYKRALESAEQGKARAFLRSLGVVGTALGKVQPKLWERRLRILKQMSDAKAPTKEQGDQLLRALTTVEDQIWAHPMILVEDVGCIPCTYGEMCTLVPPDTVVLSYFTFPDRLLIFVLGEHGLVGRPAEVPVPLTKLGRWAHELLQMIIPMRSGYQPIYDIQRALDMEVKAFNPQLYLNQFHRVLLEPVVQQIRGKHHIIVVPHGILSGLPFHAFSDSNGRALVDDAAVSYIPSLSVLRWCQENARKELDTCFAAGVSTLANGPRSAEEEAKVVSEAFGTRPSEATRDAVLQKAGEYGVIHLACHSEMESAFSIFSGLRLEDGLLNQREIAAMKCHSTLVTLSACMTANDDLLPPPGTEFSGLMGAFFHAGCPSVVASLWPLADPVAVSLAERFYSALRKDRVSIAEALRQSQLAVKARAEEGFDHPYFWAPFSLWGNA